MWHRFDRLDVLRDVVADEAVAASCRIFQLTVFVHYGNRDAVHFRFDHDGNLFVGQKFRDSFVKIGDLVFGISVVETKHRNAMLNLGKGL